MHLLAPWNFDGNDGGFTNGLGALTDEASLQPNLIANWGEDKNFNKVEDGVCRDNNPFAPAGLLTHGSFYSLRLPVPAGRNSGTIAVFVTDYSGGPVPDFHGFP